MAPTTIRVYANPHHAKDHLGECHAAVHFVDEQGIVHAHRFIGARYDHARSGAHELDGGIIIATATVQHPSGRLVPKITKVGDKEVRGEGRICFTFSDEPEIVPFVGQAAMYYARKVQDGELLAADEESAAVCQVKEYGPPKCEDCDARAAAKADAEAKAEAKAAADAKAKADAEAAKATPVPEPVHLEHEAPPAAH